jgi:ABC-2 type transport system permease protein
MRKTLEVFRFELGYQLRRASTAIYFLILLGVSALQMQALAGTARDEGYYFNSPFVAMVIVVMGSVMSLLIAAAVSGDAAARDADQRMASLFHTSPVGRPAYAAGRFLGAFVVTALLVTAFPAAFLIATRMPWIDPASLGRFGLSGYVTPYFLFALPNAFVATAVLFALAAVTRRATASYAGAALLFFWGMVCERLLTARLGWGVTKLIDPFGFTTAFSFWRSLNPLQKNAFVLTLDDALLANRLIWLGFALVLLALAYTRLRFAHETAGRGWRRTSPEAEEVRVETHKIAMPAARRVFDRSTRLRQLLGITLRSLGELHASRAWWIVPFLALFFIATASDQVKTELGVTGAVTSARLAEILTGEPAPLLLTLLVALAAGQLVWRERDARMHAIADVTPVPGSLLVIGKFAALAMMLALAHVVFLVACLIAQTIFGSRDYQPAVAAKILFGLHLPELLLIAALAMVVHVLVNQKYVATALVVLTPVATDILRGMGVEQRLFLYGSLPEAWYSEIAGFGSGEIVPRLWFTLYFGGWALLFALATYLFRVRGEERGPRKRVALARRRLTRSAAIFGAAALAIIAGAGGFIYYNTETLNARWVAANIDEQRAEFERRYGRYASLPQPILAATKLQVDFYPRRDAATIRGTYRLENRSSVGIDSIHLVTHPGVETSNVSFDRGSRVVLTDDVRGYRIHALDRPLQPGETLRMEFELRYAKVGFSSNGANTSVTGNGSWIQHRPDQMHGDRQWLPIVGYHAARELDLPADRKTYGLRERSPYPLLGDAGVRTEQRGNETIDLETIVGTDADQIGVAPGELRRTWTDNGRRYVHYVTDAPVSNSYAVFSASYSVHRAKWRDPSASSGQVVNIEIFHHPSHTANLERIVHSVRASLDYNTKHFSPYPYRQVRLVEMPNPPEVLGMTAYNSLIAYSEAFSLLRPADDPRKIDFPFAVVAHEMGHQWWGHQLAPANVEGGPFLAESLSWYSGMLVVEETFGREHLQRLLDMMRAQYLAPNQPRAVPLLRAASTLDAYRMGPFAMFALREAVGVEPVNRVLRNLLAKFPPDRPPFPTTLDFYAELRAATPASSHGLLKDLFEEITFWDLRAKRVDVQPAGNGGHRVTLHIQAWKLKGDGTGRERDVPMNDPVEIAVYDADGKPLYRAPHRIRSGLQTIELVVPRPPARAVIDPDHELLDRYLEDNEIAVGGG